MITADTIKQNVLKLQNAKATPVDIEAYVKRASQEMKAQTPLPPPTFLGLQQGENSIPAKIVNSRIQNAKDIAGRSGVGGQNVGDVVRGEVANAAGFVGDVGGALFNATGIPALAEKVGQGVSYVGKAAGSALGGAVRKINPAAFDAAGQVIKTNLDTAIQSKTGQGLIKAYSSPQAVNAGKDIMDTVSGAMAVVGGKQLATDLPGAFRDIKNSPAGKAVANIPSSISSAKNAAIENIGGNARDIISKQFEDTANKYPSVARKIENANKAGSNPVEVFKTYGNKALPEIEKGKISTSLEQKDFLKEQIRTLSELKNSAVARTDNPVSFDDYLQHGNDLIDAQQNWTPVKKLQMKADFEKIVVEMRSAYQGSAVLDNGKLPLSELDRIKTEQTGLSKTYKNPQAKFAYDAHGIAGKAARSLVDIMADSAPINELNNWIQSHYDAIKVLDSLSGKTPQGGMLSRHFTRLGGEIAGGIAGSSVGHPIIGLFAGRVGADAFSSLLQSDFISNPLKKMIVDYAAEKGILQPTSVAEIKNYINAHTPSLEDLGGQMSRPVILLNNQQAASKTMAAKVIDPIDTSVSQPPEKVKPSVVLPENKIA